jgi:hypothetical protein
MKKKQSPYFDKFIGLINAEIKGKNSQNSILLAFESIEKIEKKNKWSIYDLADYMQVSKHPDFEKFDTFFKKYFAIARKMIEKSKLYNEQLFLINQKHFELTSKALNPQFYHIYKARIFNYDIAHAAYQECLDWYDTNKKGSQWGGFWSLAKFENGKLLALYLGDTMDLDMFWESVDEQNKKNKK